MGYFLVVRILGVLLPNNMLKVEPRFFLSLNHDKIRRKKKLQLPGNGCKAVRKCYPELWLGNRNLLAAMGSCLVHFS